MNRRTALCTPAVLAALGLATAAYAVNFQASDAELKGSELTFDVTSPEAGWAVIHLDNNGKPGDHIGYAKIQKGENDDVSINLKQQVKKGEPLIVMLHKDDGMTDVFEFNKLSKLDEPETAGGKPVIDEITPQ